MRDHRGNSLPQLSFTVTALVQPKLSLLAASHTLKQVTRKQKWTQTRDDSLPRRLHTSEGVCVCVSARGLDRIPAAHVKLKCSCESGGKTTPCPHPATVFVAKSFTFGLSSEMHGFTVLAQCSFVRRSLGFPPRWKYSRTEFTVFTGS